MQENNVVQKTLLPDLLGKLVEQEKQALEFGFYWESLQQLIAQIASECAEIEEASAKGDKNHLREEIGDLMSAAVSLCIFLKMDPYQTLNENIEKIQKRFDILVSLVKQDGLNHLKGQSMDVLLSYWDKAKIIASS